MRLTVAQALVRYLCAQKVDLDGETRPLIAGVWAIFGHGNVAGLGEALYHDREALPTYRAHRPWHLRRLPCQGEQPPSADGLHHLHRAGRHEHGDRRGAGARQPPSRALAAGRRFANRGPDPVPQYRETGRKQSFAVTVGLPKPDCHLKREVGRGVSSCPTTGTRNLAEHRTGCLVVLP